MITALYILRDCEKTIINSLNSVKNKVDKIVCIVDSRSKDKTFQVCKEFADTYYYIWKGQNFADARNYGISKCTTDWILTIDDDEILEGIETPHNYFDFYIAKVTNNVKGQDREHLSVRLFRNDKNIFYENAVHETVEHSLKRINARKGIMNLSIRHTGYEDLTSEEWQNKTRVLLASHYEQLKSEPNNPSIFYNISKCLWSLKDYQGAIDFGVLSLFKPIINEAKAQICLLMYFCYKELGKPEIGINWLLMSDDLVPSQSAKANLINFYKSINDKDSVIKELNNLKQLTITGSTLPNDIKIDTKSVEQKLMEAQNGLFT